MDRIRKRFVLLFSLVTLIVSASFLAAQGPPDPCANACWQAYLNAVKACHGDAGCVASALAQAKACVRSCGLQK